MRVGFQARKSGHCFDDWLDRVDPNGIGARKQSNN